MQVLDETKVMEIESANSQVMTKAEQAVIALEVATKNKEFGPEGDRLVQEVEHHGKEVSRALNWLKEDFFGPVIESAHKTWKGLCDRRATMVTPLAAKKDRAALAVGAYRSARDRDRFEREEKERKRLEKEAEDRKLAAAVELERQGKTEQAQQQIEAPTFVPPVVFADAPKTKGSSVRTTWKFRIVNERLVPREYLVVDESAIGNVVRSTQGKVSIPGVEVYPEEKASFSNR